MFVVDTWLCAMEVLGGFVRVVMAIRLAITLPALLLQALAIITAEIIGTARGVLC